MTRQRLVDTFFGTVTANASLVHKCTQHDEKLIMSPTLYVWIVLSKRNYSQIKWLIKIVDHLPGGFSIFTRFKNIKNGAG